jgi:hypothetical protein
MIILLVGPSGIGKSATCKAVQPRFPTCVFEALDPLACRRALRLGVIERQDLDLLRTHINDDQPFLAFGFGECEPEHPGKHRRRRLSGRHISTAPAAIAHDHRDEGRTRGRVPPIRAFPTPAGPS